MFGRKRVSEKILAMLHKPIPDHVSIIGPKRYGKTVLLHHLAECLRSDGNYVASVFIDLRHDSPQTDSEFRSYLARCLSEGLKPVDSTYEEILRDADDASIPDVIEIILKDLADKKKRLAIILDAFDHLPLGTTIHPQLLEQFRSFAQISSLRLIIGSRCRLRELCKSEESRNSDFWSIFAEPIQLGAFEDSDFDDLWPPFQERTITFDAGARTELKGQTGGVPRFVAGIMEKLYENSSNGKKICQSDITELAKKYQHESLDSVLDIWEDCNQDLRNMLVDAASGETPTTSYPQIIIELSTLRGLTRKEGALLKINCRIIGEFAKGESASVQDMNRLFSRIEDYEKNIKRLLELRHSQIRNIGDELHRYAKYAINDIDDGPKIVLRNANGIVEEAIKIIMKAENIRVGDNLADEWNDMWCRTNSSGPPRDIDPFPSERGKQIRALSYICGCDSSYPIRVSKQISKQSYILLRKINDFSNYLRHRGDEEPSDGMAVLLCLTTIELIQSLEKDITAK
jgi:hypothetical protein